MPSIISKKSVEKDGYSDFISTRSMYWGEFTKEKMQQLLKDSENGNLFNAVLGLDTEFARYILSSNRVGGIWHSYSRLRAQNVLDLGSGYGSISFPLASIFENVWSVEGIEERVRFQVLRKKQSRTDDTPFWKGNNVNIVRADFTDLPFWEGSFDTIVCNGVLEWVGLYGEKNPREEQLGFLRHLKSKLRRDGTLFIGIENRFGIGSFFGAKDHSSLPFTNLLPRWLADIVVRKFRKTEGRLVTETQWKDYRTYTYSIFGYRDLLREAGFKHVDIYWCFPSYNYPIFSGKVGDGSFRMFIEFYRKKFNKKIFRYGAAVFSYFMFFPLMDWVVDFFAPEFLIYAHKKQRLQVDEDKLLRGRPAFSYITSAGNVKHFLFKYDEIIKVKEQNVKTGVVTDTNFFNGNPMNIHNRDEANVFLDWFESFQDNSRNENGTAQILDELDELCEYARFLDVPYKSELIADLHNLRMLHSERKTPSVTVHGDLYKWNILFKHQKMRVFDWEYQEQEGNPVFDVCFFDVDSLSDAGAFRTMYMVNFGRITGFEPELIKKHRPYVFVKVMKRHDVRLGKPFHENFFVFKKRLDEHYERIKKKD